MVKLEKVEKYFNKGKKNQLHVINNTSLDLGDNGMVALLGPSGSGKTTLLNAIGGLDKVNRGKIFVNGKKITRRRSGKVDKIRNLNIGYIFQDYKLLDGMSVFDNVALVLKMIGLKDKEEIRKRVEYVLQTVGMYRYRSRPAEMLSGGERQRVGIARAIVKNPSIIIADEPTGNLDSANSLEIMNIIKAISRDRLVILVTHEAELAEFYATRIIELCDGTITADRANDEHADLDYRIDNKIYLQDFACHNTLQQDKIRLQVFGEQPPELDIRIIIKNGNIYIAGSSSEKLNVVDESSHIELVDGHYQKMDKTIYEAYPFDMQKASDKQFKPRYCSILNPLAMLRGGYRKIMEYSALKKILLLGFLFSAMFLFYALSSIAGALTVEDKEFMAVNPAYIAVQIPGYSVETFQGLEQTDGVDYVLPGDSLVSFTLSYANYYQTLEAKDTLRGSLASIKLISSTDLIAGRMPTAGQEIVVDKMILDEIINYGSAPHVGIKDFTQFLGREVNMQNLQPFTIVGITDLQNPSIYAAESMFFNLLVNSAQSDAESGAATGKPEQLYDYNLKQTDFELESGDLPEDDYEVLVNYNKRYDMPLDETIPVKVAGTELTVVGYYSSSAQLDAYLVNSNTVKYNLIASSSNLMLYAPDKAQMIAYLQDSLNLDAQDVYQKYFQQYKEAQKDYVESAIILAVVILLISLVEIFLIIRSSFLSRIKEVGIYRAIGVKKRDVYRMFAGEILVISSTVSMLGLALMAYILYSISQISYLAGRYVVDIRVLAVSLLLIFGFNLLAGLLPVFHVLRKTPSRILSRHDLE